MLLLKKHLADLVRAGKKRQTIRLWAKPLLRPGQISFTPGLGKMLITAVDELPSLEALTDEDARLDGFTSRAALFAEIKKIYGWPPPANRKVFRIQFDYPLPEKTQNTKLKTQNSVHSKKFSRQPRAAASRGHSKTIPAPLPAKVSKNRMTPTQRETMRAFVIAQAPKKSTRTTRTRHD